MSTPKFTWQWLSRLGMVGKEKPDSSQAKAMEATALLVLALCLLVLLLRK